MDIAAQSVLGAVRRTRRLRLTQRRIDANRRNAMRSTGPRTPEGKARVRRNALRHGFRARDETCLAAAGEEAARKIAENIAGLNDYFHPARPEEERIIADVALNMWKADRAFALDMQSRWWEKPSGDADWPRMRNWLYALIRYDNRAKRVIYCGFDALLKARRTRGEIVKNVRTKPLAAYRRADFPARNGPLRRLRAVPRRIDRENERTNPLAGFADGPAANSLRELTFSYWQRDLPRAKHTRWQK